MIKNKIWFGIIVGLVLPFVGYAIFLTIFDALEAAELIGGASDVSPQFRQRTSGILAIALNLIPLNIFQKRRFDTATRGLVLPTIGYAVFWVIYFSNYLFR
jgi:amino acid permease